MQEKKIYKVYLSMLIGGKSRVSICCISLSTYELNNVHDHGFNALGILLIFAAVDYWAIMMERPTAMGVPNAWHTTIVYSHVFAFYQLLLGAYADTVLCEMVSRSIDILA